MDLQKEREVFSRWVLMHPDNRKITAYEENIMFDAWQAAKAQAVPKDSVVVSKWTLALALNSIENDEDNEGIIENLQELIHKAQEPK